MYATIIQYMIIVIFFGFCLLIIVIFFLSLIYMAYVSFINFIKKKQKLVIFTIIV